MRRSTYTYFFEIDDEYVGYSWLGDAWGAAPLGERSLVERLMEHPDQVFLDNEVQLYSKLCRDTVVVSVVVSVVVLVVVLVVVSVVVSVVIASTSDQPQRNAEQKQGQRRGV